MVALQHTPNSKSKVRQDDVKEKGAHSLFLSHIWRNLTLTVPAAQGALGLGLGLGAAHEAGGPHEKVGGIIAAVAVNITLLIR